MNFKRIISLMLIVVVVFSLVACNGNQSKVENKDNLQNSTVEKTNTEEAKTDDKSKTQEVEKDGLPDKDMGGKSIKVYDFWKNRWFPEEGKSASEDLVYNRHKAIQERFNFKYEYVDADLNKLSEILQTSIMSGDKFADIIVTTVWSFGSMYGGNMVKSLSDVPYMQLNKPYWDQTMSKITSRNGKIYGTAGSIVNSKLSAWCLLFNKRIINELKMENPYDLVKKSEWTWEKFSQMAQAAKMDLNGDGVMNNQDRWGVLAPAGDFGTAFMAAADIPYVKERKSGGWDYTLKSNEGVESLLSAQKILAIGKILYERVEGEDDSHFVTMFMNGQGLFYGYMLGGFSNLKDMKDDYGLIPMPKGPYAKQYVSAVDHNAGVICIPKNNSDKDIEDIGLILEAEAFAAREEFEKELDEKAFNVFRDEESKSMARLIANTAAVNGITVLRNAQDGVAKATAFVVDKVVNKPDFDFVAEIAMREEITVTALDELYKRLQGQE